MGTVTLTARLPEELVKRIESLASETGRSKTYYVQRALEDSIQDMELLYLAKQRSEDVRTGKHRVLSWDEVKSRNGL